MLHEFRPDNIIIAYTNEIILAMHVFTVVEGEVGVDKKEIAVLSDEEKVRGADDKGGGSRSW